jgi:SAM-dependent methyltransferase
MNEQVFTYDGERLVPTDPRLKNLLIEDLSKFHFAGQFATDKFILDAGCGAGQGTNHLLTRGARHVVGVDISAEAVGFASAHYVKLGLSFGQMDGARLGFPNRTFDMITSIEVIERLPDPEQYVAEIRRVLKDDGLMVLSTPNKLISSPTKGSMWPHHIHEFYPDELETLLGRHFTSIEMWKLSIPVFERHPLRRIVHWLAPIFKPILPLSLRTRFLPTLQSQIKKELSLDDVLISQDDIEKSSTLIAVCQA